MNTPATLGLILLNQVLNVGATTGFALSGTFSARTFSFAFPSPRGSGSAARSCSSASCSSRWANNEVAFW